MNIDKIFILCKLTSLFVCLEWLFKHGTSHPSAIFPALIIAANVASLYFYLQDQKEPF